jgi:hypothetical protein
MNRARLVTALTVLAVVLSSYSLRADVRADEKSRVEFGGALGRVVNIFGGKAAREGVTSTVAVKGDRKATLNETTGQIVDLSEEKVYDLDMRKKSYRVTTFAELRRRMEEAQQKAAKAAADASKEQGKPQAEPAQNQNQKQMDVDFDVKNTGQKKTINNFDTHEVIMTITVREKGKKLEESGGLVLTSDMWLAPRIAAMKEVAEFDQRYAKLLYGSIIAGVSAEQMATAMAMYPMMKDAVAKMNAEGVKMDGTAILTTTTTDAVKSADQIAEEAKQNQNQNQDDQKTSPSGGVSGLLGGFARRAVKKKVEGDPQQSSSSTFFTGTHEVLKVTTEVAAADVAVPAGFKEAK